MSKEDFMRGNLDVMASEITLIPSSLLDPFSIAVLLSNFLPRQALSLNLQLSWPGLFQALSSPPLAAPFFLPHCILIPTCV